MKHYHVVCALIFNSDGRVFCCRRGPGRALEGYYEFPGGKIEKDESKTEAIVREIKEELNIKIKPIKYIGESYYEYRNIKPYDDFAITLYGYTCKIIEGEIILTEHTDAKWLTFDEMNNYEFAKADIPFIKYHL